MCETRKTEVSEASACLPPLKSTTDQKYHSYRRVVK